MSSLHSPDRESLLTQLSIKPEDRAQPSTSNRLWLIAAFATLAVGAMAYMVLAKPAAIPVQAVIAQDVGAPSSSLRSTLDAAGYVIARRQATVSSKTTGRLLEILIEEGQEVNENQIIARLDDANTRIELNRAHAQLAQAEARLAAAVTAFDNAIPIYERSAKLFSEKIISAADLDRARAEYDSRRLAVEVERSGVAVAKALFEAAEEHQADTIIRAPFSGVVTVKAAQAGETISPVSAGGGFTRTGIGTIVDMGSLELEVDVSENFINRISAGQPTRIRLNAYPEWEIPGTVIAVVPTANKAKATVKVRIGFDLDDPRILPEMGARVSFFESPAEEVSAQGYSAIIPADAVQVSGSKGHVYLIRDQSVERLNVELGPITDQGQRLVSGLVPGSRLAVGNFDKLHHGATVLVKQ